MAIKSIYVSSETEKMEKEIELLLISISHFEGKNWLEGFSNHSERYREGLKALKTNLSHELWLIEDATNRKKGK